MKVDGIVIKPEITEKCDEFLADHYADDIESAIEDGQPLGIDWTVVVAHAEPIANDILDEPRHMKAHLRTACVDVHVGDPDEVDADMVKDLGPEIHFSHLPEDRLYDVGEYDPNDVIERTIAIRGQVTKRTKKQLRDDRIAFVCQICGKLTTVPQSGKGMRKPDQCDGCEREPPWEISNRESTMTDYQEIRLQALPEHTNTTATETVDVELTGDLVGRVDPGDRTVVNAVINAERKGETRVRDLYAEANGLEPMDQRHEDIDYDEWLPDIRDVAESDELFETIIDSIAPKHYGDRELKLAIAMSLFGGVEKVLPDGSTERGNSHIIIIGDPGAGKSDILEYVTTLVPRSEFASGKQTTSAGLTASAVKDDFGGDSWTLEAGTLVRAHDGVACIDELDKMKEDDRAGMVEAMSAQKISINKAASGTLPARTAVLAACNPKHGSFDPMMDLDEQLEFHTALLDRFDLWFILRDQPDEEKDGRIADRMNETARVGQELADDPMFEPDPDSSVNPPISPEMFRAYVAYARTIVPKLTDDAAQMIKDNFVELRQENDEDNGPVPVTARSIGGLHRLSESSARIRLSETVDEQDVERAIWIRDFCLRKLGIDPETGELDAHRFETGTPSTDRERIDFIMDTIRRLCKEHTDKPGAPKSEVKEHCMIALEESKYEALVEKISARGDIYSKDSKHWRAA